MRSVFSHFVAFETIYRLRLAVARHMARLPLGYFADRPSGDAKKLVIDEPEKLELVVAHRLLAPMGGDGPLSISVPIRFYRRYMQKVVMAMNDLVSDKIELGLTGVPETLLWPLYFRTYVARQGDFLVDPVGVSIVDQIDCDYSKFGRPNTAHAVRARVGDDLVRAFLKKHSHGTVVSLGEGLETQFWRVDNGTVSWLSVDVPEAIAARRRLLPADPRNTLLEGSAFDPTWIDRVDTTKPVFIIAAGLFMYFPHEQVVQLLSTISTRLPQSEIYFDTIPPWLSRRTLKGWRLTKSYTAPPMPFGIRIDEIASFVRAIPQMQIIRVYAYPEPYPKMMPLAFLLRIPWIRRLAPALVHAVFGVRADKTHVD